MSVKSINPSAVKVAIGPVIASGFGDDMISVELDGDLYDVVQGCDGQATRVRKNVTTATVTLTLKQSSPTNAVLSGYVAVGELSNADVFPFGMTDLLGATVIASDAAFVLKAPPAAYGNSAKDNVWTIKLTGVTPGLTFILGGN